MDLSESVGTMSVKSMNTQYDILASDVTYDASNFTMLREFYVEHNDGKLLPGKLLQSTEFVTQRMDHNIKRSFCKVDRRNF